MNKKLLFTFILIFTFFLMPRANASVSRVQIFNYSNNTFTNTYDTNNSCVSPSAWGTNMRITFNDLLQANTNYVLSLTLTTNTNQDYAWFRWGNNAMSGILIGSAYTVSSATSGTTIQQYRDTQSIAGVIQIRYIKQSNLVFNFKPTSSVSSWSVNIPTDYLYYSGLCIDNYQLQTGSTTSNDYSAVINNQNINSQNEINSINNVNNSVNNMNDTLKDTDIDDNALGGKLAEITSISDTPITDLLTLPVTLLQKLYNSLSGSCSTYSIPFGFGLTDYTLNLPCLNLGHEKFLGRVVWGAIDDLICILMVFAIFKMVIWFYSSWTTLKDNFMYLIDPSNGGLL